MYHLMQRTISHPVSVSGFGYWSGKDVRVVFRPAAVGTGIVFVRSDIGPHARVEAHLQNRVDVPRRTNLQRNGVQVEMVEHVLAALAGLRIDNCEVWVDQAEMPGCDGSAQAYVEALDQARTVKQDEEPLFLRVTEKIRLTEGDRWVEARPAVGGGLLVEFNLDYPDDSIIGTQQARFAITPGVFRRDMASCRTFVLQREAEQMVRQGLGTRVTPRDLLLFNEEGLVDNRLRYANECARHKALDLVGDLSLVGCRLEGHIVAHRSGHRLNASLAEAMLEKFATTLPLRQTA